MSTLADRSLLTGLPDAEVLACLEGCRSDMAAGELYRRYAAPLRRHAERQLQDVGLADDVVQETFLRVWRAMGSFDPARGSVRSWLFTVAHHVTVDVARSRARRPAAALDESTANQWNQVGDLSDRVTTSVTVRAAVAELPTSQRAAVALAYFDGLTQPEVAEQLEIPLGTVKTRMFYACRAMRVTIGVEHLAA